MGKLLFLCVVIGFAAVGLCDVPQCFRMKLGEVSCKEAIGTNTVIKTVGGQSDCFSKNDGEELLNLVKAQNKIITGLAEHISTLGEMEKLLQEQKRKAAEREKLLEAQRLKAEEEKRRIAAEKAAALTTGNSCKDILNRNPKAGDGVYTMVAGGTKFPVYCDMKGGGWISFQRRYDGSTNFNQNFKSYVNGFGDLKKEHWLGLDKLNKITKTQRWVLRVDMEDYHGAHGVAEYSNFVIGPGNGYTLNFHSFLGGNAGDSLTPHKGMYFSTHDMDQDRWGQNCASRHKGAWWYNACHTANLNAWVYGSAERGWANGMCWKTFKGYTSNMRKTMMKIRPM